MFVVHFAQSMFFVKVSDGTCTTDRDILMCVQARMKLSLSDAHASHVHDSLSAEKEPAAGTMQPALLYILFL